MTHEPGQHSPPRLENRESSPAPYAGRLEGSTLHRQLADISKHAPDSDKAEIAEAIAFSALGITWANEFHTDR